MLGAKVEKATVDTMSSDKTTLLHVYEALLEIQDPAYWMCNGGASNLPSTPGLFVAGIGHIPLPISDVQAEAIMGSSKGKSVEIEGSKVTLLNPLWDERLNDLLRSCQESLGVYCKSPITLPVVTFHN